MRKVRGEQCPYPLLGREGRNLSWAFGEKGVTRESRTQGRRAQETSLICTRLDDQVLIILVPRVRNSRHTTNERQQLHEAALQKRRLRSHGGQARPPPRGQRGARCHPVCSENGGGDERKLLPPPPVGGVRGCSENAERLARLPVWFLFLKAPDLFWMLT